ncbi:DUF2171 domain-containing protein [Sphingobium sufflavum]|uniref:DUF2171 domain-containing protein n=1 Tax=Sphingobium sufflavum TaxID=1129547 RepID=UPI00389AB278
MDERIIIMFEKLRIKQHMEVTNASGQHVGTVDEVDGDTIKLTRSDSNDGQHHYLDFEAVDRIEDNRVYLKVGASPQAHVAEQQHQSGVQQPQVGGAASQIDPATYAPGTTPGASDPANPPLFGTGHTSGERAKF